LAPPPTFVALHFWQIFETNGMITPVAYVFAVTNFVREWTKLKRKRFGLFGIVEQQTCFVLSLANKPSHADEHP
jgi:hypothetical protein